MFFSFRTESDKIGGNTQAGPVYQSTVNYTYDAGNRLTAVADTVSGSISRTYDGLDRALTETTGGWRNIHV